MNAIPKLAAARGGNRLHVELASTMDAIRETQALRYRVFRDELGADIPPSADALDADRHDPYCQHLLVRDSATGRVVASTRLLLDTQAAKAGGYYSESEFALDDLKRLPGRALEIGRTCVDPAKRQGAAIAVLWSGLAGFVKAFGVKFMFGCASIDMHDGGVRAQAIMNRARQNGVLSTGYRVEPLNPLPPLPVGAETRVSAPLPPLLKAYFRLGAEACGEPCHDPHFHCADVLVLVDIERMDRSYARHFLDRVAES